MSQTQEVHAGREITGHAQSDKDSFQKHLTIFGNDDGAYSINGPGGLIAGLQFQSKPVQTPEDVHGVSIESLIVIARDRLQVHQKAPYANVYNDEAIQKLTEALRALHDRTENRIRRGVEGKLEK